MVSDEISSNLLGICIWIELNSIGCGWAIESLQTNLHQVLWINALHIHSHFLNPSLPMPFNSTASNYKVGCSVAPQSHIFLFMIWIVNYGANTIPLKEQQTCSLSPEGSDVQRGSFINSQPKMVGSSLYVTFVNVFTLLSTVYTIHMKINKYHFQVILYSI